jgi:acyl-CoA synthetase (AMP-forming)/AMP-acid ligase II
MLYDRWRQLARNFQNQIALRDCASRRQWTFGELAALTERTQRETAPIAFPQGGSPDFIFALLRAWHAGQVVCPLEIDQAPTPVSEPLPKEIVHLKITSATTGPPRLIAFTAHQLMADAENIVATMGLRSDWPNLGVISLAHSYGFANLVLPLLLHGIPLALVGSSLPETVKQAATNVAPALTLAAVPALWRTWHDADAIPPNVRLAISAGAPLPLALEQSVFAARGLKIHNFYGSSECGGIAYDLTLGPRTDAACVGAPMRNVQVNVSADGCLEVRSRAVGQTYWPKPEDALGDGVFRTSDLAEIACGFVYLRGRASDLINVAGRKVSPEAIEKVLLMHPAVRECLVFGVPSPNATRTNTVAACVAVREPVTGDALKHFLLEKLPPWQAPREWWFVDSLESNQRGKLSRAEWRKRFLERPEKT